MSNGERVSYRRSTSALVSICMVLANLLVGASAPRRLNGSPESGVRDRLSLRDYEVTFNEPFDRLDVSPWGPGTRWIAHTPWNGDFGDAAFLDPGPDGPFKIIDGMLQIELRQRGDRWGSGLLSASDRLSHGFLQAGGYFEMRARLPGGPGVWPAFWLGSNTVDGKPNPEIDVLEYYGRFPEAYQATTHVWEQGKSVAGTAYRVDVPRSSLETAFHLFGVSIDAKNVIFYLDRQEVAREASRAEYLQPLYPMVNLAAGGGWPIDGMKSPSILYVDYIRAYRLRPNTKRH